MNYTKKFNGKHFDVGTGNNISLNEIKDIILKYHPDVVFDYIKSRQGEVLQTRASIADLESIGWTPQTSIEKGIHKCFQELKREC